MHFFFLFTFLECFKCVLPFEWEWNEINNKDESVGHQLCTFLRCSLCRLVVEWSLTSTTWWEVAPQLFAWSVISFRLGSVSQRSINMFLIYIYIYIIYINMAIPLSASREKGQGRLCVYLIEQGSPTQCLQACSENSTTCGAASEIQFYWTSHRWWWLRSHCRHQCLHMDQCHS